MTDVVVHFYIYVDVRFHQHKLLALVFALLVKTRLNRCRASLYRNILSRSRVRIFLNNLSHLSVNPSEGIWST